MKILFFIIPKSEIIFLYDDYTLRQAIEKMKFHKISTIPILTKDGKYKATVTEGDILWYILNNKDKDINNIKIKDIKKRFKYKTVSMFEEMEKIIDLSKNQNYVPVVDGDKHFIGMITRSTIINYLSNN